MRLRRFGLGVEGYLALKLRLGFRVKLQGFGFRAT